jgi:hypothetical protein
MISNAEIRRKQFHRVRPHVSHVPLDKDGRDMMVCAEERQE